jgi:redox-sensitive bicupin YhaK (pirin superfamily)
MATSRKKGELHSHVGEEVFAYVLEGYIEHEDGSGNHASLTQGSLLALTARDEIRHALRMERGRTARWLSIVVQMPARTQAPSAPLQVMTPERPPVGSDGTVRTALVGSNGPARTSAGLELTDIGFVKEATAFLRVGRDRRGIAYVLSGIGSVEDHGLEPGHGVLLENMSGLSLHGEAGYRVALASVPRPVA